MGVAVGTAVGIWVGVAVGSIATGVAVGVGAVSEAHPTVIHVVMSRMAQSRASLVRGVDGVIC